MNLPEILQDIRLALRALVREKGFSVAALLSLALGIGANTALFSVVYGVLMRPLPYREPERLVRLSEYHPRANAGVPGALFTNFTYHAWKDAKVAKTIEGIAGFSAERYTDTTDKEPVRIQGASVTAETFGILGIAARAGRLFVEEDASENAPPVVVLSEGLWKDRFDGDASAIGKTLTLDGKVHTIVGVAPSEFYFPERAGRLWTVSRIPRGSADPKNQSIWIVGALARLKPGFTPEQAADEGSIVARSVPRPPVADAIFGKGDPVAVKAEELLSQITGAIRPALLVFFTGVAFILLIACSNVASLQLTRGVSRQREIAVRTALGASRSRLVRLLVTESLVLSFAGGLLGLVLGAAILRAIPSLAPATFPRLDDIHLDRRAIVFTAAISIVAGLISGLLPAVRASRLGLVTALRDGSGASASASTQKLRSALVAAEVALAVVLLIGAGLLARSFNQLLRVDTGYESGNVLLATLDFGNEALKADEAGSVADALLTRVRSMPGVLAAGIGNMAPLDAMTAVMSFDLPMEHAPEGKIKARATGYTMTPGYAEALSLRLKQGRLLRADDMKSQIEPVLVNEEFARVYLNDGKPVVGRRFAGLLKSQPESTTTEIVGVVGNVLKNGVLNKPVTEMFSLARGNRALGERFQLAIRTASPTLALAPAVRGAIREIAPNATVETAMLASRVSASIAQPRFAATTVAIFALLALTLSAAGLYGALSYSVSQRRREIGVRSALGASRRDIVGLVFRQGLLVISAGLALGMVASALASPLIEALLFGVSPTDPVAFVVAPAILLAAGVLACVVPAWRGASVPPTEALRCE